MLRPVADGPDRPKAAELDALVRALADLAADRTRLAALDPELRRQLLTFAGQLAHPLKPERRRLAKAFRARDRAERRAHDAALVGRTGNRSRKLPRFVLPASTARSAGAPAAAAPAAELLEPRDCYVCKQPFRRLHHFYDSLCPACAALNWEKRHQTADLRGRVALVTGGRIKIGYQAALMLLRAGAAVVATTRFPNDAAARYAREPDYAEWRDRLQLHGLDLRHVPSVELFASHLDATLPRLDVLVNNAAQTVRRPPGFYRHLALAEGEPPPAAARPLLRAHRELTAALAAPGDASRAAGLVDSAHLSQLALAPGDAQADAYFPPGAYDLDDQQVDERTDNSWRLGVGDVPTVELLEVHLVNAIAPFILLSRLRPLLARDRTDAKHVINVSAMEAQFARRKKTDRHPHTNMAKASLNMLTRTAAADLAAEGVFMNSVDTGWITDEDPLVHVERKQQVHDFHPPLDAVDGAARVLDPLFTGLRTGRHPFGVFFKDYQPVEW
jgi:NAD(P)-dependent dehydrogenase (short-subunit alcohol dehydrogenase family)